MAYTKTYRKRYTKKRTGYRKKRYTKRAPRSSQKRKLSDGTVYRYKRTFEVTTQSIVAGISPIISYGSFEHELTDVTNSSEFINLYDQYKITGVKLLFLPRISETTSFTNSLGQFVYSVDWNDALTPSSLAQILERQSSKIHTGMGRPWKLFYRPMYAMTNQGGGYTSGRNGWQDCNAPSTLYYGMKWAWTGSTQAVEIDVYATYYLKFRCVR